MRAPYAQAVAYRGAVLAEERAHTRLLAVRSCYDLLGKVGRIFEEAQRELVLEFIPLDPATKVELDLHIVERAAERAYLEAKTARECAERRGQVH